MQRLHGVYGRRFNDGRGFCGHVFQGRFGSKLMKDDGHLMTTMRYIAHNPVEAHCCAAPSDCVWSSHADVLRGTSPPWLDRERLLSYFESFGGDPRSQYRRFVDGTTSPE